MTSLAVECPSLGFRDVVDAAQVGSRNVLGAPCARVGVCCRVAHAVARCPERKGKGGVRQRLQGGTPGLLSVCTFPPAPPGQAAQHVRLLTVAIANSHHRETVSSPARPARSAQPPGTPCLLAPMPLAHCSLRGALGLPTCVLVVPGIISSRTPCSAPQDATAFLKAHDRSDRTVRPVPAALAKLPGLLKNRCQFCSDVSACAAAGRISPAAPQSVTNLLINYPLEDRSLEPCLRSLAALPAGDPRAGRWVRQRGDGRGQGCLAVLDP